MTIRLAESALAQLATAALEGLGLPAKDAADCARILLLGELFGVRTHGLSRIESYGERLDLGGIKARPDIRVETVAPTMARVDGDNGAGPVVGMRALEAAMGMARALGTGLAFARASNHFGPVAPYAWIAAQEGFASIIGSNASTTIAPWGGRDTRLGNSPVAFCVPDPAGDPVILDMAMSVAARAKIRSAAKAGEPIPAGWATDRDGKPTTDALAALEGFLLPAGGHKGYGLALMVDLFAGLLSGGAYLTHVKSWQDEPAVPSQLGHFFFLFDVRRLGADDWLAGRLRDFRAILHSTPATDPADPVRLPGERELAHMRRQQREGIDLPEALHAKLVAFAARPRA